MPNRWGRGAGILLVLAALSAAASAQTQTQAGGRLVYTPAAAWAPAIVETPRGPYFVRVVGPAATVARWAPDIEAFFQSLSFSPTASRPF